MDISDILIISAKEVNEILDQNEAKIMEVVENAYKEHSIGNSSLPHSTFLRFPDDDKNRIIALPTYLGGEFNIAGIKWISSFPQNIKSGFQRASAMVVLNDVKNGHPIAILEGSIISAKRTAASAALAAKMIHNNEEEIIGVVGCGVISLEIMRFIKNDFKRLKEVYLFDIDKERALEFANKLSETLQIDTINICDDINEIFNKAPLVSFATTSTVPYVSELPENGKVQTILHISLRDLCPEIIMQADNVVDDIDHVSRANTSIHLAEGIVGNRDFVRCTLADILMNKVVIRADKKISIFSPFGLGVLDIALSKFVYENTKQMNGGVLIPSFLSVS